MARSLVARAVSAARLSASRDLDQSAAKLLPILLAALADHAKRADGLGNGRRSGFGRSRNQRLIALSCERSHPRGSSIRRRSPMRAPRPNLLRARSVAFMMTSMCGGSKDNPQLLTT